MEILISEQLAACVAFAFLGILTGILHDLLRSVRYLLVPENVRGVIGFAADFVFDSILMLALTVTVPITAYCYSYGRLRAFGIVAFVLASVAYRVTMGRLFGAAAVRIARVIRRLIAKTLRFLFVPLATAAEIAVCIGRFVYSNTIGRMAEIRRRRRNEAYFVARYDGLADDVLF